MTGADESDAGERATEEGAGERVTEEGAGERATEEGAGERATEEGAGERVTEEGAGERIAADAGAVDDRALLEAAREACESAYAPYSGYTVGAALLTADGRLFTGCNVENANYSNSLHAEEVALGTAVRQGHREFDRIAVSSGKRDGVTPCGMCRQTLAEFCEADLRVICDLGDGGTREYTLGELLPDAIDTETLE